MPSFVIGIDVGTTSIKGMLMNGSGEIVAFAKQEYSLETGEGGICELDTETYWKNWLSPQGKFKKILIFAA